MIKLTDAAAEQIKQNLNKDNIGTMPLRFAIKKDKNENFQYLMGFDDNNSPMDNTYNVNGVDIIIAMDSKPLLEGMTVDYVELEKGEMTFIFQNPNDPKHGQSS